MSYFAGGDAPERVVFEGLRGDNWKGIATRIGRQPSDVIDILSASMSLADHHEWVSHAANRLVLGGSVLWQAMCSVWSNTCADPKQRQEVAALVRLKLEPSPSLSLL
jgi:hypothetical protein